MKATLEMQAIPIRSTGTEPTEYRVKLVAVGGRIECYELFNELQKHLEE